MLSMYSMSLSRPKEKGTITKQGHGNNLENHRGESKKGFCVCVCDLWVNERERETQLGTKLGASHPNQERERERETYTQARTTVCVML